MVDPAKVAGIAGSYVFEIEGIGTWTVAFTNGALSVAEGSGDSDCTIGTSEETLMMIAHGEMTPTIAYMAGRLTILGELDAALELQTLFEGRPSPL